MAERSGLVFVTHRIFLSKVRMLMENLSIAVAGIGSHNVVGVKVDNGARVDIGALRKELEDCAKYQKAVYAVVAIIGSTEEGAVDYLSDILALREKFQAQGLSFLVHADAAWGGYFASTLPRGVFKTPIGPGFGLPGTAPHKEYDGCVPNLSLRADTQKQLVALKLADSITVDPHKAGYIPYPAGSLLYRDGRMRYLVTWTSPYLSMGDNEYSIGIYGVEGR